MSNIYFVMDSEPTNPVPRTVVQKIYLLTDREDMQYVSTFDVVMKIWFRSIVDVFHSMVEGIVFAPGETFALAQKIRTYVRDVGYNPLEIWPRNKFLTVFNDDRWKQLFADCFKCGYDGRFNLFETDMSTGELTCIDHENIVGMLLGK